MSKPKNDTPNDAIGLRATEVTYTIADIGWRYMLGETNGRNQSRRSTVRSLVVFALFYVFGLGSYLLSNHTQTLSLFLWSSVEFLFGVEAAQAFEPNLVRTFIEAAILAFIIALIATLSSLQLSWERRRHLGVFWILHRLQRRSRYYSIHD